MRKGVVVQAADVQDGDRKVHGRFDVRREKRARFLRMLENPQAQMESSRDVGDRAGHVQHYAVGMRDGDRQSVGLREIHQRLVVLLVRPEALGEFPGRQIVAVTGAGRVADLLEQAVEFFLVAQRQADGQVQTLRAWEIANGSQTRHRGRDMSAAQSLSGCRAGGQGQTER